MKLKIYPLWSLIAMLALVAFAPLAVPSRPSLVSPISRVVMTDPTAVTLKWRASTPTSTHTIESYDVEVSDSSLVNVDGSFMSTVDDSNVMAPDVTYDVDATALEYGRPYYWHVRANDSYPLTSPWSSLGIFRVGVEPPTLEPITGLLTLRPTFSWTPGAQNATNYTIQFSTESGFSTYTSFTVTPTGNPVQYTPTADMLPNMTFFWRVRANNVTLGNSAWAVSATSFTTANPPTTPILVSPKGTKVSPTPTLTWKPVALRGNTEFVTYQVEIFDTNKNLDTTPPIFTADEADDPTLGDQTDPSSSYKTYTVPLAADLHPATTYYWRVKAFSNNITTSVDGEYSTSVLFVFYTTIEGQISATTMNPSATAGIGNVPGFNDPADVLASPRIPGDTEDEYENHNLLSLKPTFRWELGSLNAETLTLQIATKSSGSCQLNDKRNDSSFTVKAFDLTFSATRTSYVINLEKYPNHVMCWRIRGNHSLYGSSDWSDVQVFLVANPPSIPVITAPDDRQLTDDNTPKFSWNPVTSAAPFWKYEVEISRKDFTGYLYTELVPPYTDPVDPAAYPLMNPQNPADPGGVPPADPITTDPDPAVDPDIRFPVLLQASHILKPDEVTRYANGISQAWYDIEDYPFDGNYSYLWRVRAYNMRGEYSDWSEARVIRIKPDRPTGLTLVDCVTGLPTTTATTPRPCFDWDDVYGAGKYDIQISKNSTFTSVVLSKQSVTSSFQPSIDLPKGVGVDHLYWRVRSRSSTIYGASLFTTADPFEPPNPPSTPKTILPKLNQLLLTTEVKFTWTRSITPLDPVVEFDYYEIQIAQDKDFAFLVEDPAYQTASGDDYELEYTIAAGILTPARTYYWRVRACNNAAPVECSSWSPTVYFRTAVGVTTLSPVDTSTSRPIFEWSAVNDATSYTVYVSRYAQCTSPLRYATLKTLTYQPTVSLPDGTYYWCVRAGSKTYGPGAWTTPEDFTLP